MQIRKCPTCGSSKIQRVQRDWTGEFQGKRYIVEALEFDDCPSCGEQVFDRAAMRRIQEHSPAYRQQRIKRIA